MVSFEAHVRKTSAGKLTIFPIIHLLHLHREFRVALDFSLLCNLTHSHMPDAVSVRQVDGLPRASFRFHLTMDTLASSYALGATFSLLCNLTHSHMPDAVSVRQVDGLPRASFRFHLTMDTLASSYALGATPCARDFHPLDYARAAHTSGRWFASGFLQIPPHDGHPCLQLCAWCYPLRSGLSPVRLCACRAHIGLKAAP